MTAGPQHPLDATLLRRARRGAHGLLILPVQSLIFASLALLDLISFSTIIILPRSTLQDPVAMSTLQSEATFDNITEQDPLIPNIPNPAHQIPLTTPSPLQSPTATSLPTLSPAAQLWFNTNLTAIHAAHQRQDLVEIARFRREFRSIMNPGPPECSPWVYPLGFLAYGEPSQSSSLWAPSDLSVVTILVLFPIALNRLFPAVDIFITMNVLFYLSVIAVRFYFTFRTHILSRLGCRQKSRYELLAILTSALIETMAVGDPAFRDAPHTTAWAGLTGRERVQSGWQRAVILSLVILCELQVPS